MTKRKIWIFIAVIAVVAVILLGPFPQRITRGYQGMAYTENGGEGDLCMVEMNGTIYHYLIRKDRFKGIIWIRSNERTYLQDGFDVQVDNIGGPEGRMSWLVSQVFSFGSKGYLITPDTFGTLYFMLENEEGERCVIMSPASDDEDAKRVEEAAKEHFNLGGILPDWLGEKKTE